MHALFRPRHLTVTVLVFLALGGAGFGIAGVQAADAENEVAIVQGFHVPLPAQDDAAHYTLLDEGTIAEATAERGLGLFQEEWLDVHWLEDRALPDGDGRMVVSNRVRYATGPNEVNGVSANIIAVGSAQVLGSEWSTGLDDEDGVSVHFDRDRMLPCWLRNGFQGKTWTFTSEDITTTMACSATDNGSQGRSWKPIGVAAEGDNVTVILEAVHATHFDESRTELWMRADMPYPVRVVDEWHSLRGDDMWTRRTLDLDGLHRGTRPIAVTASPVDLPSVEQVPAGDLPDASSIDMRFPLDAALAAADSYAPLQDFLTAHPDAYIGYAHHWSGEWLDTDFDSWTVVWSDGLDLFALDIDRSASPPSVDQPLGPAPLTIPLPGDDEVDIEVAEANGWFPRSYPLPADRPQTWASIPDMLVQWRAVSAAFGDYSPDSWGLDLSCSGECDAVIEVGHVYFRHSEVDGQDRTESATVMLGRNATSMVSFRHDTYDSQAPQAEPVAVQQSSISAVDSHAWVPISAAAAAGITLGALLAAVLYWLTPLLKGGLAGFSRIQRDEVLDHPGRRAIYDAVQGQPGIHHRAIMAVTEQGHGTVAHHLQRLVSAGLLSSTVQGRRTCYFVKGAMHHGLQVDLAAVQAEPARHALVAIHARPGIASPDLVAQSSVGQSTLHYHLDRLLDQGLVEKRRDGRRMTWWPTERGVQVCTAVSA